MELISNSYVRKYIESSIQKGCLVLNNSKESTEEKREVIKQEELNKNPYVLDHQNETDLIGDFGWSVIGILAFIALVGSVLKIFL